MNVTIPTDTERMERTLCLLRKGWTTALESAQAGGYLSLSQRVGDLERAGMCIERKTVKTPGGARVMAYRALKPTSWTA